MPSVSAKTRLYLFLAAHAFSTLRFVFGLGWISLPYLLFDGIKSHLMLLSVYVHQCLLRISCFLVLAVEGNEEKTAMGISAKWIKSLVGIKKHEKGRNAECSDAVSQPYKCLL
jgi:hypothetical protein